MYRVVLTRKVVFCDCEQSPKVSADELDVRIERFLAEFESSLSDMNDDEFKVRWSCVCLFLENDKFAEVHVFFTVLVRRTWQRVRQRVVARSGNGG